MNGCNPNNPAVKRILREIQELKNDTNPDYKAYPLEDNIFEWHFTIRGPQDTDFNGGIYHGRIILPSDYPFKPPNFVLLTPNGRFETGVKICLTVSAHHPEHWQPSWSIRTVLVALIGFMPTEGKGAIGALDLPSAERKELAKKSIDWKCPRCNSHNRYALGEPSTTNISNTTTATTANTNATDTNTTTTTNTNTNINTTTNTNINSNTSTTDSTNITHSANITNLDHTQSDNNVENNIKSQRVRETVNSNNNINGDKDIKVEKELNMDNIEDEEDNLETLEPIDLSSTPPNITLGQNLGSIPLNAPIAGVVKENSSSIGSSNNNNNNKVQTTDTAAINNNTNNNNNVNKIKNRNNENTNNSVNNQQQIQQPQQPQQRTFFNQSTIQIDRLIVFLFTILFALILKRLFY